MSLLKTVTPEEATGEVASMYETVQSKFGKIPNAVRLHSTSPEILKQLLANFSYFGSHPSLSQDLMMAIRLLVSQDNGCDYCIGMNTLRLINQCEWSEDEVEVLRHDLSRSKLSEKEKALLDYVLRATRNSHALTAEDVASLHKKGWDDQDIFDALILGTRMSSVNTMFNALKIERDF